MFLQQTVRTALARTGTLERAAAYLFEVAVFHLNRRLAAEPALREQITKLERLGSVATHYVHTENREKHVLLHVQLYLAQLTLNLQARLQRDGYNGATSTVLDVGDPDSIVLKTMESRQGISVNILKQCTEHILRAGGKPVQGDCEDLPFKDGAFDYVFCFETLEHVENPIHSLKELGRVCRKKLFVSIPWLTKTTIHEDNYQRDQPEPENHIFEFSPADFTRIISHTPFEITYTHRMDMFPAIRNPFHSFLLRQFYFSAFFPAFQFYELTRK
jgi:SAM-dependent methyltransferase